jgi:putative ABC transport system substrate-binding protein
MATPNQPPKTNTPSNHRLRNIRWALLATSERLRVEHRQTTRYPFATRLLLRPTFWLLRSGLALVINLLLLPIYLTRSSQVGFAQYARKRGDMYIDSYARFKRNIRYTVDFVAITIVAVASAAVSATILRDETAPVTESPRVFQVGILKRANTLDPLITSFKSGLDEYGYRDGERVIYDEPVNSGDEAALETVANEFVSQKKDLILAVGDVAALAVKKSTLKINIPTVFYANFDPVEEGLIKSYARSDNNFVGIGDGAMVKQQVELLERIEPTLRTLGVMSVPADGTNQAFIRALKAAIVGKTLTLRIETIAVADDIPAALDALVAAGATALYLAPSTLTATRLEFVAQAALVRKLILIGNSGKNAEAGALLALLADLDSVGHQLASQADQIFRGVMPLQISSEFPSANLLEINLKTAAALKLTLPPDIIERADVRY